MSTKGQRNSRTKTKVPWRHVISERISRYNLRQTLIKPQGIVPVIVQQGVLTFGGCILSLEFTISVQSGSKMFVCILFLNRRTHEKLEGCIDGCFPTCWLIESHWEGFVWLHQQMLPHLWDNVLDILLFIHPHTHKSSVIARIPIAGYLIQPWRGSF